MSCHRGPYSSLQVLGFYLPYKQLLDIGTDSILKENIFFFIFPLTFGSVQLQSILRLQSKQKLLQEQNQKLPTYNYLLDEIKTKLHTHTQKLLLDHRL